MERPKGFVSGQEQENLKRLMVEIKEHKPYYSSMERMILRSCWKLERYFTIAEAKEIVGIHSRIACGKKRKET